MSENLEPGDADRTEAIQAQVRAANDHGTPLRLVGTDTKAFYGRAIEGEPLMLDGHRGIIAYEPSELVITARTGTPLTQLEACLADAGQALAFEPPRFAPAPGHHRPDPHQGTAAELGSGGGTLGGAISTGLGGPARYWSGAPRDHVLGVRLVNGRGDDLRFGGQVMKNVAGYDVSRLVVGALGTLGVITEVSLKVLTSPRRTCTVSLELDAEAALGVMSEWARQPLPITGTAHLDGTLYVRLAGAPAAIEAARARITSTTGGTLLDDGLAPWEALRDHRHQYFAGERPLWRLGLPDGVPMLDLEGDWLIEWCGTQRWLRTERPGDTIRNLAREHRGHATLFRGGDRRSQVFQPLVPALAAVHQRLKEALDPNRVLNPGRLYPDL